MWWRASLPAGLALVSRLNRQGRLLPREPVAYSHYLSIRGYHSKHQIYVAMA
jgi:hypothetical protein